MPQPYWSTAALGCIERDNFSLHPVSRTVLTSISAAPMHTRKGDVRAPITANIQVNQTRSQWLTFANWYRYDCAGGARPFLVDLWLWDKFRRVRARFVSPWQSQRSDFDAYVMTIAIEIERESIK